MKKKNIKNLVIASSIAILTVSSFKYKHKYNPNYEIIKENEAFAKYENGLVYIGSSEDIEKIDNIEENDIIIIDNKNASDPVIKICSSHKITDKNLRNDILCILLEYKKIHPSKWNRSIESMRLEWLIHNILYDINYKTDRTKDVDFQSDEENLYNSYVLRQIFKI